MKVIVAVILAIGSASALGSGPYLPSGWRPQGPAFFLPGEALKAADSPLKETIVFETEASGSDALREYGPPKIEEVPTQGLPDVATAQTFYVAEDKGAIVAVIQENISSEVSVEQKSELVEVTEAQLEEVTETYARIADIELQTDSPTASYVEAKKYEEIQAKSEEIQAVTEEVQAVTEEVKAVTDVAQAVMEELKYEEIQATVAAVEEKLEEVVVEEAEAVAAGVKDIAKALANLEKEIKSEQVQSEVVSEVKVSQEESRPQVPEGFLEYGPPGFREYGPPKGDELLKSAAVVEENSFENNEARRRRFSPKFKATNSKRKH